MFLGRLVRFVSAVSLLFIVFSSVQAQDDVVELEFVNWMAAEPPKAPAMEALIEAFEAEYPNIQINSVALPFNEADQLLIRTLAGDPPDISMTHTNWVGPLLEAGAFIPLDDLLANLDDYVPTALLGTDSATGELMTVAWTINPTVMYYNLNLIQEAGYDAPPATFDEMMQMATDIAALNDDTYGIGIDSLERTNSGFYFYGNFIDYFGGTLFDESGSVAFDSPETVAAYTFAQEVFGENLSPEGLGRVQLRELFAQGQIGFFHDNPDGIAIAETFSGGDMVYGEDFGIIPFPSDTAGEPGPTFYVEHQLAIYQGTDHPEEAALFIDFLTSPEGTQIFNELGGNNLPVRTSARDIDFFASEDAPDISVIIDAIGYANALPSSGSAFGETYQAMATGLQRVVILGEEPAAVVAGIQAELEALYE